MYYVHTYVIHLRAFKIGEKSYAYLKSETEKNLIRLIEVLRIHKNHDKRKITL